MKQHTKYFIFTAIIVKHGISIGICICIGDCLTLQSFSNKYQCMKAIDNIKETPTLKNQIALNLIKKRKHNKKTYLRVASALSTVTLSSVASRFSIPKS